MQHLISSPHLFTFDGEVLEKFNQSGSDRYHVMLMSDFEYDEKRGQFSFRFGVPPHNRREMIVVDKSTLPALREFMAPVIAAATG